MRTIVSLLPLLFLAVPVSADPIIVGPDGYVAYSDISYGLEWESNQHLRVAFFHDPSPGDAPTTYQAEQRITETMLGDVWWYFLPFAGIDPCGRSQADLEWEPGSGDHVVIDTGLSCSAPATPVQPTPPDSGQPTPPPSSNPEPPPSNPFPPLIPDVPLIPDEPTPPTEPQPSPVPEPATVGLVSLGLAAIIRRLK